MQFSDFCFSLSSGVISITPRFLLSSTQAFCSFESFLFGAIFKFCSLEFAAKRTFPLDSFSHSKFNQKARRHSIFLEHRIFKYLTKIIPSLVPEDDSILTLFFLQMGFFLVFFFLLFSFYILCSKKCNLDLFNKRLTAF